MRILTVYTPAYAPHANRLRLDCKRLGVPFSALSYPDEGSWIENIRQKPRVLLDALHLRPFLYVDADSRLIAAPDIILSSDIAAVRSRAGIGRRWYEGVVWVNDTVGGLAALALWAHMVDVYPGEGDGLALHAAEELFESAGISTSDLPYSYAILGADPVESGHIRITLSGNASRFNRSKR